MSSWCSRCRSPLGDSEFKQCVACRSEKWASLTPQQRAEVNEYKRARRALLKARADAAKDSKFKLIVLDSDESHEDELPVALSREESVLRSRYKSDLRGPEEVHGDALFHHTAVTKYLLGSSTTEVSKAVGRSPGRVWMLLKDAGISLRKRSDATSTAMTKWHADKLPSDDDAQRWWEAASHYSEGASLRQVVDRFKMDVKCLKRVLRTLGIQVRSSR
jgi:hypothetical protein